MDGKIIDDNTVADDDDGDVVAVVGKNCHHSIRDTFENRTK